MRRALLVAGLAGPLLLGVVLWSAPFALRGRYPVLACQIVALTGWRHEGDGDPWGRAWSTRTNNFRGSWFWAFQSPGPDGAFGTGDDVFLEMPPELYPVSAHLLSLPPLGVAAFSLLVPAFALGRSARRTRAHTRTRELARSLLHVAPAWGVGLGWAAWFMVAPLSGARPWWTWAEQSPLLVSAAWSPLAVWLVATFAACHLWGRPAADEAQRPSASGSAQ